MQKLEQGIYSRDDVIKMLHSSSRTVRFRYDLLDKYDVKKGELHSVESGTVSMSALADIKRSAKFRIREENNNISIDWLNDRIQPFAIFRMPDGGEASWSLGIFLLSSPKRVEKNGKIYRDVDAYDGLQVLLDDKFDTRYTIAQDTKYALAIKAIIGSAGITKINIPEAVGTLRAAREYEMGTPKLTAANELLQEINYTSLWVDEQGYYTAGVYQVPSERGIEYTYENNALSILYPGMEEELDLFSVPNKWVVVQSNAETTPLSSIYTNSNPNSITSTVNRGRTIVDYRQVDDIADQASLDAYTRRIAYEASQVYGYASFKTAIMPMHSYMDMLQVRYSAMSINERYVETEWQLPLKAGAQMQHYCRRVVQI